MPPVAFTKTSDQQLSFDKKLGRCIGWACFSKKDGEPYVDLHGDHFPDDELLKAVDGLMKLPLEQREINVEHLGKARGTIVTAWAMTEDVAKGMTPPCDTGGTYGVLVTFEPDAELMKSIEAGDAVCLSIEGKAYDVEQVAKSAEGVDVAAAKHKRTMRKVELTKLAVVKAGAHEGAAVSLIKSAVVDALKVAKGSLPFAHLATPVAKRSPAMTTAVQGHQHLIGDLDEKDGFTSWETASGDQYGHSHPWVRGSNGTIVIGEANGHSHEIEETTMPTDIEKAQTDLATARADFAKRESVLKSLLVALVALPPDQAAFAKRLKGDELEQFLGKPEADRAALAKPIHKSERTGRLFYAGEEQLAEMQKDSDALAEKLAKSEQTAEAATFEKRAAVEIPNLRGTPEQKGALLKAVEGIADEATRKVAVECLKSASQAMASLFVRPGIGGGIAPIAASADNPEAKLDALALEIQKAEGGEAKCSFAKAYDMALSRPDGAALYAEIDAAKRTAQPASN